MKFAKFMLMNFMLMMLLTFGAVFADTYGPGVWIQKGYDTESFEHQTGPLSGTAIIGVFPSVAANPAAFMQNIAGDLYMLENAYYDGSAWQGNVTGKKSLSLVMDATNGAFKWNYAAAGTTPSFSQVMGLSSAGALTVGASLDRLTAGTLSLGVTTANAITIGSAGVTTTNAGALTVTEAFTANGNVDLGDAATDTVSVAGVVDTDIAFIKEVNRTIAPAASTTTNANGANITMNAGAKDGAGTNGILGLGTANTSAITVGATGITATVPGNLTVTQTLTGTLTGNADTATTATNATNTAITDDTTTNATMYPTWVRENTGNLPQKVSSTKLSFNPSSGILTATGFAGPLTGNVTGNADTATTATNSTNVGVTDDTTTNATMYPLWVTANTGNLPAKVASTKLSFNPSTGDVNVAGDVNVTGAMRITKYNRVFEFDEGANLLAASSMNYYFTGGGTAGTQSIITDENGTMELDTTATGSRSSTLTYTSANFNTNNAPEMITALSVSNITNSKVEVGWYVDANDCLMFRFDTAVDPANIYLVSENNNGGEVTTDTGVDLTAGTMFTFKIKINADETFAAYINGTQVAAGHIGTIQQLATFKPWYYIDNKAAAEQKLMDIDYLYLNQAR
jgi:hypothetical protein